MPIYFEMVERAKKYTFLHHFTSLETFRLIISGEQFLLNRLDKVSDKTEHAFLREFWRRKIFVTCFTHSNEGKERFWLDYAKGHGVRISIPNDLLTPENYEIISTCGYIFPNRNRTNPNHRTYSCVEDWACYDISKLDVQYIDPQKAPDWKDSGNGLIKNSLEDIRFDWEEETRIRVAMSPIGWENVRGQNRINFETVTPWFEHMYLKLKPPILQKMFVTVPENVPAEFTKKVRNALQQSPHTRNCTIYKMLGSNGLLVETGI